MDGTAKNKNINTFPPDVGVLLCFWNKNNNVCFLFGDNKHEKGLGFIHIMFSVLLFFLFVGRNKFSVGFEQKKKNCSDKNDVNTNIIMHCKPLFNKQTSINFLVMSIKSQQTNYKNMILKVYYYMTTHVTQTTLTLPFKLIFIYLKISKY